MSRAFWTFLTSVNLYGVGRRLNNELFNAVGDDQLKDEVRTLTLTNASQGCFLCRTPNSALVSALAGLDTASLGSAPCEMLTPWGGPPKRGHGQLQ